ncbi:MAG: primosomal protein N' [bacterium]|nr:primosomal protein N' [bacterium]
MKLYEVIAISRSRRAAGALTYFSTKELNPGDLVLIPLREKIVPAVVKKVSDARAAKSEIKISDFKLKPVKAFIKENFISPEMLCAVERISKEILFPPGVILARLIPKPTLSPKVFKSPVSPGRYYQQEALKGSGQERVLEYRALIREHFAREKSLTIITPRLENLKRLRKELERGIESYVFSLSSDLSPKKYLKEWNQASRLEHPVLILGTPQVLSLERPDLETLVLDEEGSEFYHLEEWGSFDFRRAAEIIAEEKKIKLIRADEILQVETIWKAQSGLIEEKTPLLTRIQTNLEEVLINLKGPKEGSTLSWLSPELMVSLREADLKNEKILIFVNRKGYSAFTICHDCGRSIVCPSCSVPLVLHASSQGKKEFLCHHCLKKSEVPERCPYCFSWKLKDYGLGLEKIELELKKLFPKLQPGRLDREILKNKKMPESFFKNKVIIASELILSYPEIKFDLAAVISLDHLFTIPDFKMAERIFRLITALKNKTDKKFILQTRFTENLLLASALAGNLSQFYQAEIKEREALLYPPFARLIKLKREDANWPRLKAEAERVRALLKTYSPASSPAFLEKIKNKYRWNIVLKINSQVWPKNPELLSRLQELAVSWEIIVDPLSVI